MKEDNKNLGETTANNNTDNFPLIFELSKPGRRALWWSSLDVPRKEPKEYIPEKYIREKPSSFPEVSEFQIVRHYTRLSQRNIGVDSSFYPLGSCTMKYNPKINEKLASLPGFLKVHPYQKERDVQGTLEVMYSLQEYLKEISGLDGVSLLPSAGAHGELTSLMVIRKFHKDRGADRKTVLIPDSAHGTNPASCTISGYKTVPVQSDKRGNVDLNDLTKKLNDNVAAFMITNPSTLGLFEENIIEIAEKIHNAGALLYMDGANMNALVGITRPGDFGVDVMHFNLHKTFSTPHGGGGPGSGPIAVSKRLCDFLPVPIVAKMKDGSYKLNYDVPKTIGKTRGLYGNVGIMVRAYCYIRTLGCKGLPDISKLSILNANYLMSLLKNYYHLPYDRPCMHEFVISAINHHKKYEVRALDIAKRLLDMKFHAPTIYFPMIVHEAMMIEPTETEDKETLDSFYEALKLIDKEASEESWKLKESPFNTPVTRLDEVEAAKNPILRWKK